MKTRCNAVLVRLLAGIAGLALAAATVQADERILAYDSEVQIEANGDLTVTEHITVRAEGDQINRGIYRDFPTRYKDRYGNRVVVDFQMLGVERNGVEEPWFIKRKANGLRINTGSDAFIERPAVHRFTLRYRTSRQIGFFADHDELYWNAIGTGWVFPIDSGQVEVRLPQPVPTDRLRAEGFTGAQGAKGQGYQATLPAPGTAHWQLTAPLAPREGFTVVLSFPKGLLAEPTRDQRIGWFFRDNRGVLIALAGLLVLAGYCVLRWRRVGRDPKPGVIIARYEPPADQPAAALRYMRKMAYDTRCFSAGVLELAVAGVLRIDQQPAADDKEGWSLVRIGTAPLPPTQAALAEALFKDGDHLELKSENASRLQGARTAHGKALEQAFNPALFVRNGTSIVVAFLIAIAATVLAFALSGGGGIPLIMALSAAMLAVALCFAFLVHAPTPAGRQLLDHIEGLGRYLGVAERDELAGLQGPPAPALDADRYQHLLPYAVALDVEEAWTRRFTQAVGAAAAAAATSAIAWYHGHHGMDPAGFTQALGTGLSATIASASTPPGSASGGGGFSGGGGGGGGGGGR